MPAPLLLQRTALSPVLDSEDVNVQLGLDLDPALAMMRAHPPSGNSIDGLALEKPSTAISRPPSKSSRDRDLSTLLVEADSKLLNLIDHILTKLSFWQSNY